MIKPDVVFCYASDDVLESMILRAKKRLLIVGPALSERVANALLERIKAADLEAASGRPRITVVLDDKAETYRLGYGSAIEQLEPLRKHADQGSLQFRMEPGVRIGALVSDDDAVIFSPTPQLVEQPASSVTTRRNGIALHGREVDRLARASGWSPPLST
ncbi:MAG: hypothetical protein F4020_04955, partial [Gammaproteobacteria bacterium]|nr:hypothetical protein [Gammaproteobacteria bacterium]